MTARTGGGADAGANGSAKDRTSSGSGPGGRPALLLGVVADDITGSGDIGSMTAKAGYRTHIYSADAFPGSSAAEVCVLDTDSRLDYPATAYGKVYAATQALQAAGCERYFNKTCSVFRGNVGAEFDAMLDALGEAFAVVVLGFPKNGRTTVNGIHYVHGERLEASPFRHDPVHPTIRSDLVGILSAQTERPVALIAHEVVAQGAERLRAAVARARQRGGYVVLDVPDQESLGTIADAVADVPVLCGSSALAEVLPAGWPAPSPSSASGPARASEVAHAPAPEPALASDPASAPAEPPRPPESTSGVLIVAGSLTPQTSAQVAWLQRRGVPVLRLDTHRLFASGARAGEVERLSEEASRCLERGEDVLVGTPSDPETVRATQELGRDHGLDRSAASRAVSGALADVAAACRARTGFTRLVVAGGDTSATVCRRLGITGMRVLREIRPGLPSCLSLTGPEMVLVLKSGSFGEPSFLEEAVRYVQEAYA